MNITRSLFRGSLVPRFLPALAAGFILAAGSAQAKLERANAYINGKQFGNGRSLTVKSGKEKISTSQLYSYEVVGKIRGTGELAKIIPPKLKIGEFMNSISPGASKLLKGKVDNPSGKLPLVLFNGKISGSEKIKGFGKVKVSLKLNAKLTKSGEIVVKVKNVSIKKGKTKIPGTIKFLKGSKVIVTTAPRIEVAFPKRGFNENDGTIQVEVTRFGFQKAKCSAKYSTVDVSAVGGTDYVAAAGTINFAKGETKKSVGIQLIDNALLDGKRQFNFVLSDPSSKAVIGPKDTTVVSINDDD